MYLIVHRRLCHTDTVIVVIVVVAAAVAVRVSFPANERRSKGAKARIDARADLLKEVAKGGSEAGTGAGLNVRCLLKMAPLAIPGTLPPRTKRTRTGHSLRARRAFGLMPLACAPGTITASDLKHAQARWSAPEVGARSPRPHR